MDDMDYDPEMEGENEDDGEVIEIGQDQLEALLLRYQAKKRGEDPGPPILDENGEPIELTDQEAEIALQHYYEEAQMRQQRGQRP